MPLKYEDYSSKVAYRKMLELELDEMNDGVEKHLLEIAEDLMHLDELTVALNLKRRVLRDIQEDYPNRGKHQRYNNVCCL